MSIIVKAGSDICKANTNTSTAKFQYSFSKASRFPIPNHAEQLRKELLEKKGIEQEKPKKAVNYEYQYYKLLPSTLSQRKTTFGKGNKYDFTKVGNNCKAACYEPYTDFDQKNPHGPKYSFTKANRNGKGPTKTKLQEIKEKEQEEQKDEPKDPQKKEELIDPDGPSPAKYNYLKQFGWDAPKVSMKGRHNTPIKKKGEKEGEENEKKSEEKPPYLPDVTIRIRTTGKYVVSQIPNVNSLKFDKDKSKRTQFVANKNPGPKYDIKPLLQRVAQSQYRSYEPITIAGKHTVKDSRSNYPGPGSYPLPSDFGIYQSKDASKYPQENVYPEKKIPFEEKAWRHNMKKIEPKKEEEDEGGNNYNQEENNEETPGGSGDNDGEEKRRVEEEEEKKRKEEEEKKKAEEAKKKEEEEEKKKAEEDKKNEEDKESECIMLYDILMYKEGEDNQTPTPGA